VVLVVLEVLVLVVETVVVVVVGQTQDGDGDAELDGLGSSLAEGDADGLALFDGLALLEGLALFEGLALLLTDGEGDWHGHWSDGDTDALGLASALGEFAGDGEVSSAADGLTEGLGLGAGATSPCENIWAPPGQGEPRKYNATSRANRRSI